MITMRERELGSRLPVKKGGDGAFDSLSRIALEPTGEELIERLAHWFEDEETVRLNELPKMETYLDQVKLARTLCSAPKAKIFGLRHSWKLIGWVALVDQGNGCAQVPITIAEKAFRNKGYGEQAMRLAEDQAVLDGFTRLTQKIAQENETMLRLSEKSGFTRKEIDDGKITMEKMLCH